REQRDPASLLQGITSNVERPKRRGPATRPLASRDPDCPLAAVSYLTAAQIGRLGRKPGCGRTETGMYADGRGAATQESLLERVSLRERGGARFREGVVTARCCSLDRGSWPAAASSRRSDL